MSKINGSNGKSGRGFEDRMTWKVGLVNHQGKYLTAESFGCKINATGTALKRKQTWSLEYVQGTTVEDCVYIRSYLGRYLTGDKRGNALCSEEEVPGAEGRFVIQLAGDGSGRWALRNEETGYYFGGTDEHLKCYEQQPGKTEQWTVHLAIHPQIVVRSSTRQAYLALNVDTSEGSLDSLLDVPMGSRCQLTLEYQSGRYHIRACDGRYLNKDGSLSAQSSNETSFSIELKSGQTSASETCGIAFKDCEGKYLTVAGREGRLKSKSKSAGKDEVFIIEGCAPQVTVIAHNGKMVTFRQGIDMSANKELHEGLTAKETYQLEFDGEMQKWRLKTDEKPYWSLEEGSSIRSVGHYRSAQTLFTLEGLDNGLTAIRAGNNRYVTARMNGTLYADSDDLTDKEKFRMPIVNKEALMLRCEHGLVGLKQAVGPRLDCGRPTHDVMNVISSQQLLQLHEELKQQQNGSSQSEDKEKQQLLHLYQQLDDELKAGVFYAIKGPNGKYLTVDSDNCISADSLSPVWFLFELRDQCKVAIKTREGKYLSGEQNGLITAKSCDLEKATLWEI